MKKNTVAALIVCLALVAMPSQSLAWPTDGFIGMTWLDGALSKVFGAISMAVDPDGEANESDAPSEPVVEGDLGPGVDPNGQPSA